MKKYFICFLIFLNFKIFCISIFGNLDSSTNYIKYPEYKFNEAIIGLNMQLDILDISGDFGIGGSVNLDIFNYHPNIGKLQYYDFYLHHFKTEKLKKTYFFYGIFAGFRQTEIHYTNFETPYLVPLQEKISMLRPLIGYRFTSEDWGLSLFWSQTEGRISRWGYELKVRDNRGIIFKFGGCVKGPISIIKSELYFRSGYEFAF